jgi:hypothetical protein
MSEIEKNRVAKPKANAKAPNISKSVEIPQLTSGGNKLNGKGKFKSPNQLVPCNFSKPDSPNSQAKSKRINNGGMLSDKQLK